MSPVISVRPNASKNCTNAPKRRKDVCLANTLYIIGVGLSNGQLEW